MDNVGDRFTDAIALARSVLRDDWDGIEAILAMNPEPLDLLIPQSWLLNAAIAKLSNTTGVSVDDIWAVMLASVSEVAQQEEDEDD